MRVISGFSPAGYIQYGKKFLETFDRFWPKDIELHVYTEEPVPMPRGECFSIWDIPGCQAFILKHSEIPSHVGREPAAGWKSKELAIGYSWRYDAVKFCRQLFIPDHAIDMMLDDEIMVWLDGDVISFDTVDPKIIIDLLGDADVVYLGRKPKHSELGFWAVRVNERTRRLVRAIADLYRTERVFALGQTHSANVFDNVVAASLQYGLKAKNATPKGEGHVWFQTPLATCLDHLKGDRKLVGFSKERRDAPNR